MLEAREFCERYTKELKMTKVEKQIAARWVTFYHLSDILPYLLLFSRQADAFKSEGNDFFAEQEYEAAILCYTSALNTCPLVCTGRRVTYYRFDLCT